jgi:hypothetical protein
MIVKPTMIDTKFNMALSLFLRIAIMPMMNPAKPNAAMMKVGKGKKATILTTIRMINAIESPDAHLPLSVVGKNLICLCISPNKFRNYLAGLYHRLSAAEKPSFLASCKEGYCSVQWCK